MTHFQSFVTVSASRAPASPVTLDICLTLYAVDPITQAMLREKQLPAGRGRVRSPRRTYTQNDFMRFMPSSRHKPSRVAHAKLHASLFHFARGRTAKGDHCCQYTQDRIAAPRKTRILSIHIHISPSHHSRCSTQRPGSPCSDIPMGRPATHYSMAKFVAECKRGV